MCLRTAAGERIGLVLVGAPAQRGDNLFRPDALDRRIDRHQGAEDVRLVRRKTGPVATAREAAIIGGEDRRIAGEVRGVMVCMAVADLMSPFRVERPEHL
jgi:hypothetical protein